MINNIKYIFKRFIKAQTVYKMLTIGLAILMGGLDLISSSFLAIFSSLIIINCDFSKACVLIVTLLLVYFIIRLCSFRLTKEIEKMTYIFRNDEISNIASKILKTDYERLQSVEEQNLIEGAYYAVLSGSNAGLEYQLNELFSLIITMIASQLIFIPGVIMFPKEAIIILLCNIFLLIFLDKKIKIDSKLIKDISKAKANSKNVLKQCVNTKSVMDVYVFGIHNWLLDRYLKREEVKYKTEDTQYRGTLIYTLLTIMISSFIFSYSLYVIQNSEYINGVVTYVYLLLNITAMCKKMYTHMTNISNNNNFVEQWRMYDESFNLKEIVANNISQIYSIELKNIAYVINCEKYILKDINIKIKIGEKIAFVGKNGAGKTTLAKIILGVLHPTEGEIIVNNINVSYDEYSSLVSRFGYTPQENSIFAFSVATNIIMDEYVNDKQDADIYTVLKRIGLFDIVERLKDKENTYVGKEISNEGVDFSGGEKRKLLIARSLYHKRDVNIYDEPTSSLDSKSEREFYEQIRSTGDNCISIFISHRIGTTNFCDKVYILENGKIVQHGQGEQLLKENGAYKELFQSQIIGEDMQ